MVLTLAKIRKKTKVQKQMADRLYKMTYNCMKWLCGRIYTEDRGTKNWMAPRFGYV